MRIRTVVFCQTHLHRRVPGEVLPAHGVKTVDVGLSAFEMRWLIEVICPARSLFADVRTYTTLRNLSFQRSV